MIIVTGATGRLGSQVVERLLERVPAGRVGVGVRDTTRAADLAARGVRVRHGDFTDPDSLDGAFEGASQVLVVSVGTLGDEGVRQATTAIDAAYRCGADRVLYTSHQAARPDSLFPPARDHAAVEAHLAGSGRAFTSLRNGFYAESLAFLIGDPLRTGEIRVPSDGPVSWTTREDLAAGAAAVLTGERPVEGPTPPLTAAEAVDMEQVAATLSAVSGRTIRRVLVDDEDWVASTVERGVHEPWARTFLGTWHATRRGEFAVTDPALGTLLGREPQSIRASLGAVHAA